MSEQEMKPVGHISEYGLEKLQTSRHYCVSVSYLSEKEYQIPIYTASALTALQEENARLREALGDIARAAKLAQALCDDEDREPWVMIEERARAALADQKNGDA